MNENTITAILNLLAFVVPLLLVGIGALIYDHRQKRKTRPNGNYKCSNCGHIFPQKTATISGYESHPYGLHVNCSNCGRVVEQFLRAKE